MEKRPLSHYKYLDLHFDTVLTRLGRQDMIPRRGNFSSSGDKYYSYRERWEAAGVPWYHGAIMYHLLELLYSSEARQTDTGWVHPWQWVINNYENGHNLSQYMKNLVAAVKITAVGCSSNLLVLDEVEGGFDDETIARLSIDDHKSDFDLKGIKRLHHVLGTILEKQDLGVNRE